MKEPIVLKHTRQMERQEMLKSSLKRVRYGLLESDLLYSELTVLLLLLSLLMFRRSRAIEVPLVDNALTHEDIEEGL